MCERVPARCDPIVKLLYEYMFMSLSVLDVEAQQRSFVNPHSTILWLQLTANQPPSKFSTPNAKALLLTAVSPLHPSACCDDEVQYPRAVGATNLCMTHVAVT